MKLRVRVRVHGLGNRYIGRCLVCMEGQWGLPFDSVVVFTVTFVKATARVRVMQQKRQLLAVDVNFVNIANTV